MYVVAATNDPFSAFTTENAFDSELSVKVEYVRNVIYYNEVPYSSV